MPEPTEALTKTEMKPEESSLAKDMAPWKLELGKLLLPLIIGIVGGGSVSAGMKELGKDLKKSDLPAIAIGAAVGGALAGTGAIAYAFVNPLGKKAKKAAGDAGDKAVEAIDWSAEQLWAKATKLETKYCLAQAEECEGYRPEGMRQYSEIKKPMLRDVFVPLLFDGQVMQAGHCGLDLVGLQEDLDIWKLLKRAQTDKEFRRIAVLAWGGFGKTTLLRHVAYTFGRNEQGRHGVKERVPFLLLLRQHKPRFALEEIPPLPELIRTEHLSSLGRAAELKMPQNWEKEVLESGRAIVMLDGFDELNPPERTKAAKWLNQQMSRYSNSVFIITSRPKAFKDQPLASQLDVTMPIWVRKFDRAKQQVFIEQWYRCQERLAAGERRETEATKREALRESGKLMAQINERPELQALATNPLLLNMIVTFHRRRPWGKLPVLRADLYRDIFQLQVVDRPEARDVETVLPGLDALGILQRLALEMMQRGIERISQEDLLLLITEYLRAEGESRVEALKFVEDVVNVSEVLVDQNEEYDFAHLSFQEYLAAAEIVHLKQESLLYEKLKDDRWKAVIVYYAGLAKNPSSLVRRILTEGNTALASDCLQEAKKLEADVVAELEALKQTVKTDRYAQLATLLQAGEWEKADRETDKVMLEVSGQTERGFLMPDDLESFPCEDLRKIDQLWVKASNGHFGFSVQKKIWQECGSPKSSGGDWDQFCVKVGWQDKQATAYVEYSDLKKNPSLSPEGELPWGCLFFGAAGVWGALCRCCILFSRAATCEL